MFLFPCLSSASKDQDRVFEGKNSFFCQVQVDDHPLIWKQLEFRKKTAYPDLLARLVCLGHNAPSQTLPRPEVTSGHKGSASLRGAVINVEKKGRATEKAGNFNER